MRAGHLLPLLVVAACASTPDPAPAQPVEGEAAVAARAPLPRAMGGLVLVVTTPDTRLYLDDQELRDFDVQADGTWRVELVQGGYALRARRGDAWSAAQRVRVCPGLDTRLDVAMDEAGSRLQVQQPLGCDETEPPAANGRVRFPDSGEPRDDARDPCVEFCSSMTFLCIGDCKGEAGGAEPNDCMVRCARDMGRCVDACR